MGYNSKALKASPLEKKNPRVQDVIVDPMGQWKYPGQITKIPSSNITMQGVNYPVLGVDNLGNQEMMQPGMDYSFPGDSVTEYPQLRRGGLPRKMRYTSQNMQSSINQFMKNNEILFGPLGRHYYEPSNKKNMYKKKSGGEAFPQQPTQDQFFNFGLIPSGPQGFYNFGGVNETPEAFPQLDTMEQFFHFNYGGTPCMDCGGHMKKGGQHMMNGAMMLDEDMPDGNVYQDGGANWIQKATANMRTDKPCTGAKFGGPDCPPGSPRYNLAKTFRGMANKQFGGGIDAGDMSSSQDLTQDNFLLQYNNTFKGAIKNNTTKAIADEVANGVSMQNEYMAQNGMSMPNYGYNPNMQQQDLYAQKAAFLDQQRQGAGKGIMSASENLMATSNPYMDWSTQTMQDGGSSTRADYDAYRKWSDEQYYAGQQNGAQGSGAYNPTPNYQNQWKTQTQGQNTQGSQGARAFPMNYNPYMQWSQSNNAPAGAPRTGNTVLQSYEAKKQLFGPGARKVKMTFRTYYNPQTGQVEQVPAEQSAMKQPGYSPTTGPRTSSINTYAEDVAAIQAQAGELPDTGIMPRKGFEQTHGRDWFGKGTPDIKSTSQEIRDIKREQRNPFAKRNAAEAEASAEEIRQQNAPATISKSMRPVEEWYNSDPTTADFDAEGNWIGSNRQNGGVPPNMYIPETTLSAKDSTYFTKELTKPMYDPNKYSFRSVDNSKKGTRRNPVDDQVFKMNLTTGKENLVPQSMWDPTVMKELMRRQQIAAGQEPTYTPLFWPQPQPVGVTQKQQGGQQDNFGRECTNEEKMNQSSLCYDPNFVPGQEQNYFDTTITGKRKMGLDGEASANWLLAGISGVSALAREKENQKTKKDMRRMSLADNQFSPVQSNAIQNQGRWNPTGMSYGMMDPFNMDVIQQPGQNYAGYGKQGGSMYQAGGEYEMTDQEIEQVLRNGGSITYLD